MFQSICDYCERDEQTGRFAMELLQRGIEQGKSTVDQSLMDELFDFVESRFDDFIESCQVKSQSKIIDLFKSVDRWHDHFREATYDVMESLEDPNKSAIAYANFMIEKAIVVVSEFKAGILYSHLEENCVYYNIYDDPLEAYLEERNRLIVEDCTDQERDVYYDVNANIVAFYAKVIRIVRDGLIEASKDSETGDLPLYREQIHSVVEQGLPFFVDYMANYHNRKANKYLEATSWVETTCYCLSSVILAAELWAACDENRSDLVNYLYFQRFNLDFLSGLLNDNLKKHKSETGLPDIDERLNDLGEWNEDQRDSIVPSFDPTVLNDSFITREMIDDAIRSDPAKLFSIDNIYSGKDAENKLKELYPLDEIRACILVHGKEIEVYEYLNAHLDRNTDVNAIALLVAARKLHIVEGLNYRVATRLFGNFCGKSMFNYYYNEAGGRKIDDSIVKTYMAALQRHFSLP